jgi:hypothetical protein
VLAFVARDGGSSKAFIHSQVIVKDGGIWQDVSIAFKVMNQPDYLA